VPDEALAYLLGALAVLLFVPVVGAAMAWLVRRVPARVGTALGVLGAVLVVALPLLLTGIGASRLAGVALLAVVLLGAFAGVGSVLAWAGRRVIREVSTLGPMVARVLPTFMLASLFFFYNTEIWQVMVALRWSRIHAVVAVMLLLTVFLVAVTTRDEVSDLLQRRREDPDLHDGPPLRWDERFNVLLVPSLVTLIQTAVRHAGVPLLPRLRAALGLRRHHRAVDRPAAGRVVAGHSRPSLRGVSGQGGVDPRGLLRAQLRRLGVLRPGASLPLRGPADR